MTGKQRAFLRAMVNEQPAILHIGKEGITRNVMQQAWDALEARELIKVSVQKGAEMTAREACDQLCALVYAEPVQCIGSKFSIYRASREKLIKLPD